MTRENFFCGFKIITENSYSIESETLSIVSAQTDEESPYFCLFKLQKEDKSRDNISKVKCKIQMTFDPDGSRFKVLVDDEILQDLEFTQVLKGVRNNEWGIINMKLNNPLLKGSHLITLSFDTCLGSDPFRLQIKDVNIG